MKSKKNLGQVADRMFNVLERLPEAKDGAPAAQERQETAKADKVQTVEKQSLQRPTVSVMAEDLVIEGKITAKGDIELRGALQGDLSTGGNIRVSGKVTGDLRGRGVQIVQGEVRGNITADESVAVDKESLVVGDICADSIQTAGRLKGNLKIKGKTVLVDGALLFGNVETGSLSLEEGAVITGSIKMDCKTEETFFKEGARPGQ